MYTDSIRQHLEVLPALSQAKKRSRTKETNLVKFWLLFSLLKRYWKLSAYKWWLHKLLQRKKNVERIFSFQQCSITDFSGWKFEFTESNYEIWYDLSTKIILDKTVNEFKCWKEGRDFCLVGLALFSNVSF